MKLVEQEWYLIVRDPNSVVRDPKTDCIRGGVRADPYVDRLTRRRELDRVLHEVGEDLPQPVRVRMKRWPEQVLCTGCVPQSDLMTAGKATVLGLDIGHELGRIHGFKNHGYSSRLDFL